MDIKHYAYETTGVCSREIKIATTKENTIHSVSFVGGCAGNAKGLSSLLTGMDVQEVIDRLSGVNCGGKTTSCPDQLSKALMEIMDKDL
ncbi:MAG: TIGR03905 family TSCPD domain-containing protein [Eubacteriaceae bacterium]|nr:TIGR03905 family TSCPD domain-containing protein [Eubacteriaceae bacterium]